MATGRQRHQADEPEDEGAPQADPAVVQAQSDVEEARAQLAQAQQDKQDAAIEHERQLAELNARLEKAQQEATLARRAAALPDQGEPNPDYNPESDGYVVLTSAVTVRYGPKPQHNRRYVRGMKVIRNEHNGEQIDRLVQLRGLAPNDGTVKAATTARVAAIAAGAQQDTVARTPIVDHLPQALPSAQEAAQQQAASDAESDESDTES